MRQPAMKKTLDMAHLMVSMSSCTHPPSVYKERIKIITLNIGLAQRLLVTEEYKIYEGRILQRASRSLVAVAH